MRGKAPTNKANSIPYRIFESAIYFTGLKWNTCHTQRQGEVMIIAQIESIAGLKYCQKYVQLCV